jgi:hypothetical protein
MAALPVLTPLTHLDHHLSLTPTMTLHQPWKKNPKLLAHQPMTQIQPPEYSTTKLKTLAANSNHFQRKETKHQHNSTLNMPPNDCGAIKSPFSSLHVPKTAVPAPSSSLLPSS